MARPTKEAALKAQNAELQKQLKAALSRTRGPADPDAPSVYFAQADAAGPAKKGNLSQTARHFESAHPAFMDILKRENSGLLTMKQFHSALAAKLRI